jgi:DNA-binding CsgD family transcriptional regulator
MMKLSERQMDIVVMVGRDGYQWERVARELSCHPSTVRAHVRRVMKKFDTSRKPREAMVEIYCELKWKHKVPLHKLVTWGD